MCQIIVSNRPVPKKNTSWPRIAHVRVPFILSRRGGEQDKLKDPPKYARLYLAILLVPFLGWLPSGKLIFPGKYHQNG